MLVLYLDSLCFIINEIILFCLSYLNVFAVVFSMYVSKYSVCSGVHVKVK